MRQVKNLLQGLTVKYPPGSGQRHAVGLNTDGDLEITLFLGEHWQAIIVTDEDLDAPVDQALIEIDGVLPAWCKETNLNLRKPPENDED